MSLGKIIWLSILLGAVVGFLSAAAFGDAVPSALIGAGTAFVSVIAAGLIQPPPKRRARRDAD